MRRRLVIGCAVVTSIAMIALWTIYRPQLARRSCVSQADKAFQNYLDGNLYAADAAMRLQRAEVAAELEFVTCLDAKKVPRALITHYSAEYKPPSTR